MTTTHHCHARDCDKAVPPRMLMCRKHWRMVPANIQAEIWRTYRPGQEIDKRPSREWAQAAAAAVACVAEREDKRKSAAPSNAHLPLFTDGGEAT